MTTTSLNLTFEINVRFRKQKKLKLQGLLSMEAVALAQSRVWPKNGWSKNIKFSNQKVS